jgi:predicted N-acetyltransferase YhbS
MNLTDVTIKPEEKQDYGSIEIVNDIAFKQKNESILINKLREKPDFIPNLSLVAKYQNEIIGHILFFPVKIIAKESACITLSLAPMSIHPDFQNKGIGSLLIKSGLEQAKKEGFSSIIVIGHPNYYPRFGFLPASKWGIMVPFDVPDNVFLALELYEDELAKCHGMVDFPKEYFDSM